MNETKPAFASSAVWGALIAGISAGAMLAGVKIEGLDDPELPLQISTAIGSALALYGRLKATAEINGWFK